MIIEFIRNLSEKSAADTEISSDLERDGSYTYHEHCEKCSSVSKRNGIYASLWNIFVAISFWLLVALVLGIWLRQHAASSRALVPHNIASRLRTTLFMPDERFNPGNQTEASDEAWAEMHLRLVMIEKSDYYGLSPSIGGKVEGSRVYAVAAFHQLHCL
ncbi:hypothetical protein LMH87_004966 [Akanthomyces muscarius]|uniref:Uncharacterized protein n=1 Tax=Akanthomyces muscarius TaxID=2231603 RepID=A0A9W8URN1_AKAMU|nr:hypothetical protein LMH87_004966 [Akanthomyces muscarius]KAJ4163224.1 hypothetical protein LMH87_004966 [Akanthomyces muscarius]